MPIKINYIKIFDKKFKNQFVREQRKNFTILKYHPEKELRLIGRQLRRT